LHYIWSAAPLWRRRYNTHKVDFVIVYYPWHPLYSQKIKIVSTLNRGGEIFYKVRLKDTSYIELPFWMADKEWCQQFKLQTEPYCSVRALLNLKQLLDTLTE